MELAKKIAGEPQSGTKPGIIKNIIKYQHLYVFTIPVIIYFVVFKYFPIFFLQTAFRDYRITRPLADSPWIGFKHFATLFSTIGFTDALMSTIKISLAKIICGFPVPVILALLLNEIRSSKMKRMTQTIIYLPHFISWVVIAGIIYDFLTPYGGIVNKIISSFGVDPIFFMGQKQYYIPILVLSDIWKEAGWGTIIYLAAISNIDPQMYESAMIDGATRFQRLWHITLPSIKEVIITLLILRLGSVMNVGFEQIMVIGNPIDMPERHVLETYTYFIGLLKFRYSFAAAAGLFQSLIAGVMVFAADRIAKSMGERGLI